MHHFTPDHNPPHSKLTQNPSFLAVDFFCGHYDERQIQGISLREAAILQSFPDDYIFYPTEQIEPIARMVGNAVPPKLISFLAEYLTASIQPAKVPAEAKAAQSARPWATSTLLSRSEIENQPQQGTFHHRSGQERKQNYAPL